MPMHRARCALPAGTGHMRCHADADADANASAIDRARTWAGRTRRMHAGESAVVVRTRPVIQLALGRSGAAS
jgi:uncharacterized protein YjlB